MEAEIFFNRFEFEKAEICIYKAIHKLNNNLKSGLKTCLILHS